MNFSAAASSSAVVTPGRSLLCSRARVLTRMSPAAAILSISSGLFLMIMALKLVFEAQCGQGSADVIVHLGGCPSPLEPAQQALLLVVVDDRLGLLVVDLEPVLDGVGLVVVALHQPGAVLVAHVLVLGRVEL